MAAARASVAAESVRSRIATSGTLDPGALGPVVRRLASGQGVGHGAWVPVVVDGELHGVLAVAGRNRPVSDQELSSCVAIVGIMELALKNALAHQGSQRAALTDPLTSLTNRRGMEQLVLERRGRRRLAVLAIDVDRLKEVNDRHGHAAHLSEPAAPLADHRPVDPEPLRDLGVV